MGIRKGKHDHYRDACGHKRLWFLCSAGKLSGLALPLPDLKFMMSCDFSRIWVRNSDVLHVGPWDKQHCTHILPNPLHGRTMLRTGSQHSVCGATTSHSKLRHSRPLRAENTGSTHTDTYIYIYASHRPLSHSRSDAQLEIFLSTLRKTFRF